MDGPHECGFGGRNVRPPQFQEKFATHPVHLSIEPALSGLLSRVELPVQSGQSGLNAARFCLTLCEQRPGKRCK
jgi:hypothetical protein